MQHDEHTPLETAILSPEKLPYCVLTIAGSDSCGGAGIQADLKAFAAAGVHGASVISSITAQNTLGVFAIGTVTEDVLLAQLDAVLEDLPVRAIKTGMLPSQRGIELIAARLAHCTPRIPLVVDPVLVATSGFELSGQPAMRTLQRELFPLATVITPNLDEASALTGLTVNSLEDMEAAGQVLLDQGCQAVLMKGGHLASGTIADLLIRRNGVKRFSHAAQAGSYHGTGCTLSASIAARLARGESLESAASGAIEFVQECIRLSRSPERGVIRLLGLPQPIAR